MKNILYMLFVFSSVAGYPQSRLQKYEAEIRKAEADFNALAQSKSISEAFYAFADENAVIKRENDTLIKDAKPSGTITESSTRQA